MLQLTLYPDQCLNVIEEPLSHQMVQSLILQGKGLISLVQLQTTLNGHFSDLKQQNISNSENVNIMN